MSTPGQPTENAFAERFFKTVKWEEEVYMHLYQTFEETQASLQMFLEDVYNAKCLHSSLDYLPLNEFELKYAMCSCLGGLEFLGGLKSINCQTNCHSASLAGIATHSRKMGSRFNDIFR